jgi:hypothetical protein
VNWLDVMPVERAYFCLELQMDIDVLAFATEPGLVNVAHPVVDILLIG